ncbi:hypothetical protein BEL04_15475 [Mucilaginibacter sp. PPCGB 2223]|uniref:hypothetical protein n=1 Tax=Mucilaginibacter sp. PPCGB 2223 TaxID=1886027 RepID=UPI0008259229|nr:hypothetical protein [Mucilaginibacter sp. PPCGB 2223]OCX51425.1 hypothetical protein BEL04_15475 [Mucilaginibacter sp. PPCGB 2223]
MNTTKYLAASALFIAFTSCNKSSNPGAIDKRFCGRWLTGKTRPVLYALKPDGSFTDRSLTFRPVGITLPKPVSWSVEGKILYLHYNYSRYYFKFFKVPVQFTLRDTIKQITDSTLVLTTPSTKKYISHTISLIKMKENGKYTTD